MDLKAMPTSIFLNDDDDDDDLTKCGARTVRQ